ncbi:uncharacterized protein [Henckelia pumila]|uniref:uncharacterized protein n=1 Tax=Henckelia pumila TaxID=405737 RepID=UPI003C6E4C4B
MTKKALENRGTAITWTVFKTEFYQRFFPMSYRKDKGADFATLQQGNMNIEDYVAKVSTLLRFAPHIANDEEAKADQFINGLNLDIITLVNAGRPNNFVDALNKAKGAEDGQSSGYSRWFCNKCGGRHSSDECKGVTGNCNLCNRPGNYARVFPTCRSYTSHGVTSSDRKVASEGRVFALTEDQAQAAPDNVIVVNCVISGYPAYVLIDTGASHTFIAEKFVALHAFPVEPLLLYLLYHCLICELRQRM